MNVEAFDNILLEDTFVFSWDRTSDSLIFTVLASLLQSHQDATPPAKDEWACYRPGIIRFSGVSSVDGLLSPELLKPAIDADGSIDYGCIDELSLVRPGEYLIVGEFGEVTVAAREVSLILDKA
jgi:hypothetical protein